ncbi:MAG: phage terminase large subunit family protein, partial [Cyanobacteria bacterium P01_A01_bin.84]
MHLLPKRDKHNQIHAPRLPKRTKKIDIVLWVCCATVGLGSVLAAAAIIVGRRGEVTPTVSAVNRAKVQMQSHRRAYIEKLTRTD